MMYEFSEREIRNKFKETEYGKKTNKWLYTFITITLSILVFGFIFGILIGLKVIKLSEAEIDLFLTLGDGLFFLFLTITCYFDGKRDGAIEQFKRK